MQERQIPAHPNPVPSFPNRPSGPTEESLKALKEELKRSSADFCAAFDGEGDRVAVEYGADRINTMDGIRISLEEEGWVLIRASNTSPLIRVTVEGATEETREKLMKKFVAATRDEIRKF